MEFDYLQAGKEVDLPEQSFILKGFAIQGAEYDKQDGRIALSQSLGSSLPDVIFRWVKIEAKKQDDDEVDQKIQIPVYLNNQRRDLITSVNI